MPYQTITSNFGGARKRREKLDGRDHLVVPTVMLTEGVFEGSEGPLLYQADELSRNPQTWNHKPAVINHPTMNGAGISACDPTVIDSHRVGIILNTGFDGRLKTETWLDIEKVKLVDRRVFDRLEANQAVEVSTGLYHDLDQTPGVYKGKPYKGIVRNMQPDHLAILPDLPGACSLLDGAGLLRNAGSTEGVSYNDIREQVKGLLAAQTPSCYCYVADVYKDYVVFEMDDKTLKQGYKVKAGKVALQGEPEPVRKVTSYVTANNGVLVQGIDANFSLSTQQEPATINPHGPQGPPHQEPDVTTPNATNTPAAPPAVQPAATQTPPSAANPNPPAPTPQATLGVTQPNREQTINDLITAGAITEADRPTLRTASDGVIDRLVKSVITGSAVQQLGLQPALVGNAAPAYPTQPMTEEQFLAVAPPSIRQMVLNARAQEDAERAQLIQAITANAASQGLQLNPEGLKALPTDNLRLMGALAGRQQPGRGPSMNYAGQGQVPSLFLAPPSGGPGAPTGNAGQDDVTLGLPSINFEDARKTA